MIVPDLLLHIKNILKNHDIKALVGSSVNELQKTNQSFIVINQNYNPQQTQNQYKNSGCDTIVLTTPIVISIVAPSKQNLDKVKTLQEQIVNIFLNASANRYYNPVNDTSILLALTGVQGNYEGVDVNDRHILNINFTALWQTIQV